MLVVSAQIDGSKNHQKNKTVLCNQTNITSLVLHWLVSSEHLFAEWLLTQVALHPSSGLRCEGLQSKDGGPQEFRPVFRLRS